MAEKQTTCAECGYDGLFEIINTEVLNNSGITANVNTKCPNCSNEFSYPTWTNSGRKRQKRGLIW